MKEIINSTPKQLKRIAAIHSAEQISSMSAASIKLLTNDFDEQIILMIIARFTTADEQLKGLNCIREAFDKLYYVDDPFNGSFYEHEPPIDFNELSLDLELGILVTAPSSPVEPPTEEASPADWITATQSVCEALECHDNMMRASLLTMEATAKESIDQLNSMRNGMLTKLTEELISSNKRNDELKATVNELMEEMTQLKLEQEEQHIAEPTPYQKAMSYENVTNYIASRPLKHKREDLINMLEALLPKEMHAKLRNDIEEKVEARDAEKASKRRKSKASARIIAQSGSTVNIIEGTNINHADNVSSK